MKVAIADVAPVGTNVGGEVTVASINMDGFAFQALSGKNLYKNLVKAIVRELSTNGIDSHIEAGKDDPIFVHLPTAEEPWFAVRDEGIGLDDYGVRNVFLTFFGSTKRENNELIGAYGLGSKSPLGYSDNFTVTAIKDGVKRMFVIFKNESGCPAIKMLAEMATTEANGVEVKVPVVDSWDYSEFHTAAADVYQWFPVKPILNVELAYPESSLWVKDIVDGVDLMHNSKQFVVHGMIAYPLDMNMLNKLDRRVRDIFSNSGLVIHAENGTVEYSMSREELSYKEGTVDYLSNKLTNLANALKSRFIAEMDGMNNWDRFLYVEQIAGRYREIRAQIIAECHSPLQVAPLNAATNAHNFYKDTQVFPKSLRTSGRGNVKVGSFDHNTIIPKEGYSLLINDQGLSDALLTKKLKHNYSVEELKELANERIDIIHGLDKDRVVEKFMEVMGYCPPLKFVSELNDVPKKPRVKGAGYVVNKDAVVRKFNNSSEKFMTGSIPLTSFDEPFFYILMDGASPAGTSRYQLKQASHQVNASVYGVNKKFLKDVQSNPFAVSILDEIKNRITAIETKFKVEGIKRKMPSWIDHQVRSAIEQYEDLSMYAGCDSIQISHYLELNRMLCRPALKEADMVAALTKIDENTESLESKYKLLSYSSMYQRENALADYIGYIHSKNQTGESV